LSQFLSPVIILTGVITEIIFHAAGIGDDSCTLGLTPVARYFTVLIFGITFLSKFVIFWASNWVLDLKMKYLEKHMFDVSTSSSLATVVPVVVDMPDNNVELVEINRLTSAQLPLPSSLIQQPQANPDMMRRLSVARARRMSISNVGFTSVAPHPTDKDIVDEKNDNFEENSISQTRMDIGEIEEFNQSFLEQTSKEIMQRGATELLLDVITKSIASTGDENSKQPDKLDSNGDNEQLKNDINREPNSSKVITESTDTVLTLSFFADYLYENRIFFIVSSFYCIFHCFEASSLFRLHNYKIGKK
jgi:hypothetical protein